MLRLLLIYNSIILYCVLYSQVIYDSCTSDDASSVASEQPIVRPPRRVRTKAEGIDLQSLANRLHCKSRRFAKRSNHCKFNYSFSLWFSFVFVYLQRFVSSMILNRRWKPEISTQVALKLNQNCFDHRHYNNSIGIIICLWLWLLPARVSWPNKNERH